ncbi:glycosyltransferase involved in cell wall biosynthesis [Pedobacter psychrotolerans]|uniref:Glycosyl transferase family 1 n=1 Tax=Pedobacter psychrotolerans TaxID=1843235 RepID=A0A4R2HLG6_9SPHI|nr:glycosyltransferase family 1 protein [Pedobacter psychrotolerans]TCO30989.1 glycosyltransferase involved in cell wall biosynthesis [Pedobacter psychrotolerans]GGE43024.1 glycosyl transferase family 1 [Pedobacter psychrotolerans]
MKAESEKQISKAESSELDQSSFGLSALSFPLKISFDGKRAANNLTGLGNYSRSLIESLAKQYPEHQYLVYSPKVKHAKQIDSFFEKENISLKLPKEGGFLWRSLNIIKDLAKDQVQLFHGLSHEIPFAIQHTKIKSIVTIHDLIFLRFPQYYQFIDRKLYEWKSRSACKRADQIIAISEKTKADIVEFYNINPDKIKVIYQSCDDGFKTAMPESTLNRIKLTYKLPEKYILNVGTIEARKNLRLLIQALKTVDHQYKLVVIGKETAYFKEIERELEHLALRNRVIFLKNIPFADLPGIYQMAELFVYPSFYEGFGIPIIEALYSQVPVIAATGSCLEEAGGPNSVYVSPTDVNGLSDQINRILANLQLQKEMKEKGLEFVQKFNSPQVTKQLMDCYSNLLDSATT